MAISLIKIGTTTHDLQVTAANVNGGDSRWLPLSGGTIIGNVTATNFYSSSDKNLKTNINPLTDEEDVNLYSFDWKDNGNHSYGFIAQELEATYPELVKDFEGYKRVDYNAALTLMLAKAMNRIKSLENEIQELKIKVEL